MSMLYQQLQSDNDRLRRAVRSHIIRVRTELGSPAIDAAVLDLEFAVDYRCAPAVRAAAGHTRAS